MRRYLIVILLVFLFFFCGIKGIFGQGIDPDGTPSLNPSITNPSPGSQMVDIHDIKPLVIYKTGSFLIWALIAVILLSLLAAFLFYYYKKKKREKGILKTPELSADALARQSLDEIADIRMITGRKFYFKLSAIIRRYIEDRFRLMAAEMTTEEFLPRIKSLALKSEVEENLRALLLFADPIKYAGQSVSEQRMQTDLDFAYNFVDQTMIREDETSGEKGIANTDPAQIDPKTSTIKQ